MKTILSIITATSLSLVGLASAQKSQGKQDLQGLLDHLGGLLEGKNLEELGLDDLLESLERGGIEHYLKDKLKPEDIKRLLGAGAEGLLKQAEHGLRRSLKDSGLDLDQLKDLAERGSLEDLLRQLGGEEFLDRSGQLRRLLEGARGPHHPRRAKQSDEKELSEVFKAFRPVVAEAAKSTVAVMDGEDQVALGTIISDDGLVLTKASEVGKREVECVLADGRRFPAEVVKTFPDDDLLALRIQAKGLSPIRWHSGPDVELGSFLAAPNPEGQPIAVGVASVAPRDLSERNEGFLGIGMEPSRDGSVGIQGVLPGSPAEHAGLRAGDRILALNGKKYGSMLEFSEAVQALKPGEEVELSYRRGQEDDKVRVRLQSRAIAKDKGDSATPIDAMSGDLSSLRGGFPKAMQHDLPLEPNQCGGPLVDLDGRVIGLNIARAGRVKTYALPSSQIIKLMSELAKETKPSAKESPVPVEAAETKPKRDKNVDQLVKELEDAQRALEKARKALEEAKPER